jgi:3-oxoacid CoA-transferase subunit A
MYKISFDRLWIRGDTHGDFSWLAAFCEENQTTYDDAIIITGDHGFLYYGSNNWREKNIKEAAAKYKITIICLRGNHDDRPQNRVNKMLFSELESDPTTPSGYYWEPDYPHIWYVADGSVITINDKRFLFVGGSSSVDKEWRLLMGWRYFKDEELTREEFINILDKIDHRYFDYVITHTCPEAWMPTDLFMKGVDQSKVSRQTEEFLTTVSEIIDFDEWWFGHFHDDRFNMDIEQTHAGQGMVNMIYNKVIRLI